MIFADPDRVEDLKRRADDLSRPLQDAAFVLSQLNWRTWKSLDGMLAEDDSRELAWRFLGRGYRRSVRNYRDLDRHFDVLAELVCEDDDTLITLLNQRIRNIPGVLSTETFVYLKLHKQHYNWGTR